MRCRPLLAEGLLHVIMLLSHHLSAPAISESWARANQGLHWRLGFGLGSTVSSNQKWTDLYSLHGRCCDRVFLFKWRTQLCLNDHRTGFVVWSRQMDLQILHKSCTTSRNGRPDACQSARKQRGQICAGMTGLTSQYPLASIPPSPFYEDKPQELPTSALWPIKRRQGQ